MLKKRESVATQALEHKAVSVTIQDIENQLLEDGRLDEECFKIWSGIQHDERAALIEITARRPLSQIDPAVTRGLKLKSLIIVSGNRTRIFSHLFREFVERQPLNTGEQIVVEETTKTVWIRGQPIDDLTPLEFNLLAYLYKHKNQLCSKADVLATLYPNEEPQNQLSNEDSRLPSLVTHLRKKIEPDPGHPRFLRTVWGQGLKLDTGLNPAQEPERI